MSHQPHSGTISSVVAQERVRKHMGQRVNVFVDDRFSFALDRLLAVQHGLRPGLVLDAARLEELLREDGDARAYAKALHYLSYRMRTSQEIRERLTREEWPDACNRTSTRTPHS
jgi:regulatory protein